jgi:cysteine desulfurase
MDAVGVDSVAVSGHKFHGPRGAGFLALSSTARLAALQVAGGQEYGLRGGTENVAGAVGMATAAEIVLSHQAATEAHTRSLTERVFSAIREALPDAERLGHPERRLPHILSMRLPGVVGQTLLERCDARGLAFSTGSACHGTEHHDRAQDGTPDNHVLAAIGLDRSAAREVVRLSFSLATSVEQADEAARILVEEAKRFAASAPRGAADGARRR